MFRNELKSMRKYVPGKSIEAVKEEYGLEYVNKLASNENPLGPSEKAVNAIMDEVKMINIYPDPSANILTKKLALELNVSEEQIILSNGGEEILKMIAQTFINAGDEAIMATPSFGVYQSTVSHLGGVPIEIPLDKNFEHDFDAFINAITDKTKLIYICNPNNPTGNIMCRDKIEDFLGKVAKDIVVVFDEAYYEFAVVNKDYPNGIEYIKSRPNIVVMRTFSKVAGLAGIRVGYGISSKRIINEMAKVRGVFCVNRLAQVAASAALEDKDHINKTVDLNYHSMELMENFCKQKNLRYVPSNSNFMFMESKKDSKEIFENLQKKGVVIRPGYLWGYDNWIRVSTGTIDQTANFIESMETLL